MFSWLIVWTAESSNKCKVGADGLTCYEIITKNQCKHEAFGFRESVIWQMAPDKIDRNKLDSNFRDWIFLGVVWRSGEFIVATKKGIVKCQTLKARPTETSYHPSCVEYIRTDYSSHVLQGAKTKGATAAYAESQAPPPPAVGLAPRAGNEWPEGVCASHL